MATVITVLQWKTNSMYEWWAWQRVGRDGKAFVSAYLNVFCPSVLWCCLLDKKKTSNLLHKSIVLLFTKTRTVKQQQQQRRASSSKVLMNLGLLTCHSLNRMYSNAITYWRIYLIVCRIIMMLKALSRTHHWILVLVCPCTIHITCSAWLSLQGRWYWFICD